LRKFGFGRGGLEAGTSLCDCIQLLNKNSLWIRFGFSGHRLSVAISKSAIFEAKAEKDKKIHKFARKQQRAVESMPKEMDEIFGDRVFIFWHPFITPNPAPSPASDGREFQSVQFVVERG
jgi:hypothetical protein